MGKTYFDLTPAERAERSRLTPEEKLAVQAAITACRALPRSITIEMDRHDGLLVFRKRITKGSCVQVAALKKKSLAF